MNRRDLVRLQRLLAGELDAQQAGELRDRMAVDAELRRSYETLERTWSDLDLPDLAAPPSGFAQRVGRAAVAQASERVRWSLAPMWAQAAAAFALAGGIALGLGIAGSLGSANDPFLDRTGVDDSGTGAIDGIAGAETTLAETYWQLLDETASESPPEGDSQ